MRIFSCHHVVPERVLNTPLFQTFPLTVEYDTQNDPTAPRHFDNRLSEMRHQHYIWKNYTSDEMVGFEHYRRLFLIVGSDAKRIERDYPDVHLMMRMAAQYRTHHFYLGKRVLNQYLDYRESLSRDEAAGIEAHFNNYDIVTVPVDERDMMELLNTSWPEFHDYIRQTRFFNEAPDLELVVPHQCYWLNCYVMKRPIFEEYMSFVFNTLAIYEANIPNDGRSNARYFGHITERLFSVFLYRKRLMNPHLKVLELPTMWYHTDLDPDGPTISHDWRHEIINAERRGIEQGRRELQAETEARAREEAEAAAAPAPVEADVEVAPV